MIADPGPIDPRGWPKPGDPGYTKGLLERATAGEHPFPASQKGRARSTKVRSASPESGYAQPVRPPRSSKSVE